MADGTSGNPGGGDGGGHDSGGSWWGGWLKSAMNSSTSALEFIKRDLVEFTSTMERDTTKAAEVTKTALQESLKKENSAATRNKVKQEINKMFDGLSKVLTVTPPEKSSHRPASSDGAVFDRKLARLHAVQVDTGTYLNKPSGRAEDFQAWLASFNMEEKKGDISELLVSKVEVRALYTRLVPSEVSHGDFWQRYFYKLHQLKQDEARKEALMKRAETPPSMEELDWDSDWSGDEGESPASQDPRLTAPAADPRPDSGTDAAESANASETRNDASQSPGASSSDGTKASDPSVIDSTLPSLDPASLHNAGGKSPPGVAAPSRELGGEGSASENVGDSSSEKERKNLKLSGAGGGSVADASAPCPEQLDGPTSSSALSLPESRTAPSSTVEENKANLSLASGEKRPSGATAEHESEPVLISSSPQKKDLPKPLASLTDASVKDAENPKTVAGTDGPGSMGAAQAAIGEPTELKTKIKGDMVMVGTERESPTSESSDNKEASLEEDWEQDFDVELTEEDLKAAEEIAKRLGDNAELEDDWENWE